MALSQDLKEALLSALRMPEYRNEMVNAIETGTSGVQPDGSVPFTAPQGGVAPVAASDLATKAYVDASPAGTGDINSDGSVPFAANQSMGGNKLTNVGDPTSAQDVTTQNYVDNLTKNVGLSRARYVDFNKGNDTTGTGTLDNPYKTITAAQLSFSDQSAVKPYTLFLAPGAFSEVPSYVPKQYVSLIGSGRTVTTIAHSDNSVITISYGGTASFNQTFQDLSFGNLTITRQAGQTAPTSIFNMTNVSMGTLTMTGSGNTGVGPFIFDNLNLNLCSTGNVNGNAINLNTFATNMANLTFTAVGVDATTTSGLIQGIRVSRATFVTVTGSMSAQFFNSESTRVTLNDTLATFTGDAQAFPTNTLAAWLFLNGGATKAQVTKRTGASRIRNNVKTVLTSPNTIDHTIDYIVKTNLTVAGPVTLNLPSTMASGSNFDEGTTLTVIDAKGDAATNNITVNRGGTDTFAGGATTDIINTNFGRKMYIYSTGVWYVISSNPIPATTPGGADTQVQFNDGGVFGGDAGLTYNKTQNSLSVGTTNTASGLNSLATGSGNLASGTNSFATGSGTTANAARAHAEGDVTTASGLNSHAEGSATLASGTNSHAEGDGGIASNLAAHAEGKTTIASGRFSHAGGEGTTAQGYAQRTIGRFNVLQGTSDSVVAGDDAFIVGNGTADGSRKNAFSVTNDSIMKIYGSTSGYVGQKATATPTPYNITWPSAQGGANTVLGNDGSGNLSWEPSSGEILVFTSTATTGGAATEAVTVTGLLATDTILSVSQKTPGVAVLPLLGWSTQVNDGITVIYSADPSSGAVVLVAVKR